ncbi:MAG: HEAT repeat domain-containing protein [Proteobacteria bacterium]|nr:HEAT repeat domain-containing protein [Pseudomonadota bacterium]
MKSLGILLLFTATTAVAAPVAAIDVDGERAELGDTGVLTIAGKRAAKLTVGRGATLATARFRATTMIVVASATEAIVVASATEAIVVAADDGKPWRSAGRVPIGGVGLDADYAYAIDATPGGLVRYQVIAGATRCDRKPAYLFAEMFDPATGKLAKVVPPSGIDPAAPVLQARLDRDPASSPLVYRARLASTQPGATDAGALTRPEELDDGTPATTWSEGAGGNGRGHFITFEGRARVGATQLRIVPGDPRSAEAMRAVNRPKRLGLITPTNAWWVELPDPGQRPNTDPLGAAYAIDLPSPAMGCLTIVLDAAYPGTTDATTFAELEVFAEGERTAGGGEAVLARLVAVTAIEAELAKTTDVMTRHRLVMALAQDRDPTAATALATAATAGALRDADLHEVIDALGTFGQTAALATLARQTRLAGDVRAFAASKIDATRAEGLAALVDLAGTEPRELRRAVIDALARAPLATLFDAAATMQGASPDVVRALTKQARVAKASEPLRAQIVAALIAGLTAATDYEHRYRVIDAIATLGDAAALATLERTLRTLPAGSGSAALRQVAIRAIAQSPRGAAMPLVIGLASDRDPGVRLAALGALATVDADPGGPWHAPDGPDAIDRVIITAVSTDRWPEVRRRAAESLGNRCERVGPAAALTAALDKDRDPGVRVGSLTALVQCHATGVAQLLRRLWDDGKAPLGLRTHAVDETVILGDAALAEQLVGKLAAWRGAAIESKEALELAQHAAVAIGRLAPSGAPQALLAALDDSAYPEIVSAAALGLGALGPACPAAAKVKLLAIASEDEALAIVARRAAAQCGK